MANGDWGLKVKKDEEEKDKKDEPKVSYADVKPFEENEHEGIKNTVAGAIYKLDIDNSHPLAFGYPNYYFTLKQDERIYEFLKEGWNVGIIKKDGKVAGFTGSKVKDKIKDGTAIGVQEYGQGSIIYFSDDPVFRCFWENGKLMLANAVFFVGQ
jgi:hypothetical protein